MEHWVLDPDRSRGSVSVGQASGLISAIGSDDRDALAQAVLGACDKRFSSEHCSILEVSRARGAAVLSCASKRDSRMLYEVGRLYGRRFFARDSAQQAIGLAARDDRPQLLLHRREASRIEDADYRALCYEKVNACDRISILVSESRDRWFAINFYRDRAVGLFARSDLGRAAELAPLLGQAVLRHGRVSARGRSSLADRAAALGLPFTRREREVLVRIAGGMTLDGIAADLGIGRTSVITYRNRAFARLGINRREQLFARLAA